MTTTDRQGPDREGDILAGIESDDIEHPNRSPHPFIESDRVAGTAVYNREGEKIGTVRRFLVEKRSGRALYAEMVFGGFLGIGAETHPLPWELLDYEIDKGGYVVDLSEEELRAAPCHADAQRRPIDDVYGSEIRTYYGLPPMTFL